MGSYWARHRLLLSLITTLLLALIASVLFVFPCIIEDAKNYNAQSIYKNTKIDFIAPEPSYEQIDELQGSNGIDKVFPFFMTKKQVTINGLTRNTNVLLCDRMENIDITMYSSDRLIEKSKDELENPIFVDWQFCQDTSAKIGDKITITISGKDETFHIFAIYETNALYDGGAILAGIDTDMAEAIKSNSKNNGYSGMYISASNYKSCRTYLTNDYRPLGRLKDRDAFADDDQYQIHYDAIMSSGYANEITDFRIKESETKLNDYSFLIWLGSIIAFVLIITFNIAMGNRSTEKGYFAKHCAPKGINVIPYYNIAFAFELISFIVLYMVGMVFCWINSSIYIPKTEIDHRLALPVLAFVFAEFLCLIINKVKVSRIAR